MEADRMGTRALWMETTRPGALAFFMKHRNVSVRALAKDAGVAYAVVGHLKTGRRTTCTPYTAGALERSLDVPTGTLFQVRGTKVR
jgi:plasmid maintenance system antidote protein VapI